MIPAALVNPFNVDAALEFPHPVQAVERWTEYCYFFGYDPQLNIGISIHIGRLAWDLSMWRGILYVLLPDGDVLAHKYAGRDGSEHGLGAGPFKATCIEPMQSWLLEFDGALQRTNYATLAREVMRDAPDEHVKFHLVMDAAAPLFSVDIVESRQPAASAHKSVPHHHHEQIARVRGDLYCLGQRYQIDGVGARDHSSGPRDYSPLLGAFWAQILFPSGKAVHVALVGKKTSGQRKEHELSGGRRGYIYWGDGTPLEMIDVIACPDVCQESTAEGSLTSNVLEDERLRKFQLVLGTSRGVQTLHVERHRAVASTYIPASDEVAGTDLSRRDSFQQTKTVMRVQWDGEIGHGMSDNLAAIRYLRRSS